MHSAVYLTLLGAPEVRLNGRAVELPPQQLALLAVLAVDEVASRSRLSGLFWPDKPESRARTSLNQLLHSLTVSLGCDIFGSRSRLRVCLDRSLVDTDIWMVAEAESADDWQTLIDHCSAPFLEGFAGSYGNDFEDWLSTSRRRYRDLLFHAHVAGAKSAHGLTCRTSHAEAAHRLCPSHEPVLRSYLELLAEAGRRVEALAVCEAFKRALRDELGVAPSRETRQAHLELLKEQEAEVETVPAPGSGKVGFIVPESWSGPASRRTKAVLMAFVLTFVLVSSHFMLQGLRGSSPKSGAVQVEPLSSRGSAGLSGERLMLLTRRTADELAAATGLHVSTGRGTGYHVAVHLEDGPDGGHLLNISVRDPSGGVIHSGSVHLGVHVLDAEISRVVTSVAAQPLVAALGHDDGSADYRLTDARLMASRGGVDAARVLIDRAEAHYQSGAYSEWVRDSAVSEAWQSRAWASVMSGDIGAAGEDYDSALSVLRPYSRAAARQRRAELMYSRWASHPGDTLPLLNEARSELMQLLKEEPGSSTTLLLLAEVAFAMADFDAALAAGSAALRYDAGLPDEERWQNIFFFAAFHAGRDEAASAECDRIRAGDVITWRAVMCTAMLAAVTDYASAETAALLMRTSDDPLILQKQYRPMLSALVGLAFGMTAQRSHAEAMLPATSRADPASALHLAALLASLEQHDAADDIMTELNSTAAGRRQIRLNPRLASIAGGDTAYGAHSTSHIQTPLM